MYHPTFVKSVRRMCPEKRHSKSTNVQILRSKISILLVPKLIGGNVLRNPPIKNLNIFCSHIDWRKCSDDFSNQKFEYCWCPKLRIFVRLCMIFHVLTCFWLFLCSWGDLGRSWGTLGHSRVDLGRSWDALGRSWGALGSSWGALGRSWGALGRSWGALGALLGLSLIHI